MTSLTSITKRCPSPLKIIQRGAYDRERETDVIKSVKLGTGTQQQRDPIPVVFFTSCV
jgi:hypothetical protein